MNTQMRKLAEQAAKWVCENEPRSMDDDELFRELYMEKYAELIVRECSQMVVNSHPDDLPFVGGKMLVHFGVSE
jgi:hypothetical protein